SGRRGLPRPRVLRPRRPGGQRRRAAVPVRRRVGGAPPRPGPGGRARADEGGARVARGAPRAVLTLPAERPVLALLHTSPVHVPVSDARRGRAHPGLELLPLVAEDLLERARADGPATVADAVRARVREAVDRGARAVLCTCSTIGGVAEAAGAGAGVAVLRVDRPMAAAAVAGGPRVGVLAAPEETHGPTAALPAGEARRP